MGYNLLRYVHICLTTIILLTYVSIPLLVSYSLQEIFLRIEPARLFRQVGKKARYKDKRCCQYGGTKTATQLTFNQLPVIFYALVTVKVAKTLVKAIPVVRLCLELTADGFKSVSFHSATNVENPDIREYIRVSPNI